MKRVIVAFCLFMFWTHAAFALSLHEAKSAGLVGEGNDGYLAYVVKPPSPEVEALVQDVNSRRRAKFASTAKNNQLRIEQVEHRFYQRAVEATEAGGYYQDAAGKWLKK